MIELHDFIESTLFDIAYGVQKAKIRSKDLVAIAPPVVSGSSVGVCTDVAFDIMIKTSEKDSLKSSGSGKVGGRVKIFVVDAAAEIGGGLDKTDSRDEERSHRVSFSVPMYLAAHFRAATAMAEDHEILNRIRESENAS